MHCGTEETFGQTLQEAHAAGVPVVAPDCGGPRHIVKHQTTGFLVDWTKWGAFRSAVETITRNPAVLWTMSVASRESVAGKTWEANNRELLRWYEEAKIKASASQHSVAA